MFKVQILYKHTDWIVAQISRCLSAVAVRCTPLHKHNESLKITVIFMLSTKHLRTKRYEVLDTEF